MLNPAKFSNRMPLYADKIYAKVPLLQNVWGFIDGTLRKTCHPSYFFRTMYSGHKHCHGLKFQTVCTPDGYIACMFGPINGNHHDSFMLENSGLIAQLQELFPLPDGAIYQLYGDPAYLQSHLLMGGFCHAWPRDSSGMVEHFDVKGERNCGVWGNAGIIVQWQFHPVWKKKLFPVAKFYVIGAFLCNAWTCFYGNQTSVYFGCDPLSLAKFLGLIDPSLNLE